MASIIEIVSAVNIETIFVATSTFATVAFLFATVIGAIRSGILKQYSAAILSARLNGIEVRTAPDVASPASIPEPEKPFETGALSAYYNHALLRANVSFWFSLIFATIGFGVIIFAFATHDRGDLWGTVVKAASGTIIDSVSALFFVQSTNAQKSMGEFFEKLRLDRMNAVAREIISEISGEPLRDELRAQLALKYAAIDKLVVGTPTTPPQPGPIAVG